MALDNKKETATGAVYAAAAFLLWGILPLYWKQVKIVPPVEILMHRIFWSCAFTLTVLGFRRQWSDLRLVIKQKGKLKSVFLAAVLVSLNWGIYIWAVNSDHVVDASLGYYINPLLSVFLGMLVLQERLSRPQAASLVIALAGVLIITFQYGKIPWIALSLAITFGLYGLVKKKAALSSFVGLALETLLLLPLSLAYLIYVQLQGTAAFGPLIDTNLLLIGAGVATAIPLWWFAEASQRIPLSLLGLVQYLTPTMMLLIGVVLYKEPFTRVS